MEEKRLPFGDLNNTRDLADLSAAGAPRVIGKRLIRSGALTGASRRTLDGLRYGCKVHTVIDLRTGTEREHEPEPAYPGFRFVHLPLLGDDFFGIARDRYSVEAWFRMFDSSSDPPEEIFYEMYRRLVFDRRSVECWRRFFEILLANREGAVLWHCSAGKDRAGIAAMLTLLALGFPREAVIFDYMRTAVFTREEIDAVTADVNARTRDPRAREAAAVLMETRRVYPERLFETMDSRYGGPEAFFGQEGILSAEERRCLRRMYLKGSEEE